MCSLTYIAFAALVCLGSALRIELSTDFIKDVARRNQDSLDQVIYNEVQATLQQPLTIHMDWNSLKTLPGPVLEKSATVQVKGSVQLEGSSEAIQFVWTIENTQQTALPYKVCRSELITHVQIDIDQQHSYLRPALTVVLTKTASRFNNWPSSEHLPEAKGMFPAYIFGSWTAAKVAGSIIASEQSILLDYSARDLHLSTNNRTSVDVYGQIPTSSRYVGLTLSDVIIDDLLHEFFIRRRKLDVRKFLFLFEDFRHETRRFTLGEVAELFSDLEELYGPDTKMNFILNPKEVDDETLEMLTTFNKMTFSKDSFEAQIAFAFVINLESKDGNMTQFPVRKGSIALKMGGNVKLVGTDMQLKMQMAIKQIKISDVEGEQMDLEEDAIKGLFNLQIKKSLKPKVFGTSTLDKHLQCAGAIQIESFNLTPGFLNLSFAAQPKSNCDIGSDGEDTLEAFIHGFEETELKMKRAYVRRQMAKTVGTPKEDARIEDL